MTEAGGMEKQEKLARQFLTRLRVPTVVLMLHLDAGNQNESLTEEATSKFMTKYFFNPCNYHFP